MKYCLITNNDELIQAITIKAYNSKHLKCNCIIKSMHSFYENLDRLYKSDVLLVDSRINKYVFRVLQLFIIKSHKYKNAYKILRIILTTENDKNNFNYFNIGYNLMLNIDNLDKYPSGYLRSNIISYRKYLKDYKKFLDNKIVANNLRTEYVLRQMKIPTYLTGYKYLKFYLQTEKLTISNIIGKNEDYILSTIARKYKKPKYKIKRSIVFSIETSHYFLKETMFKVAFFSSKIPSVSEFIAGLSFLLFLHEKTYYIASFNDKISAKERPLDEQRDL